MNMKQIKLAAMGTALAVSASAQASVMVNFDGYSTGEVVGQPATGTKWTGTSARFAVDATAGVGGGYGLISATTAVANSSVTLTPTRSEIGGTWGTDNIVTYSFKAKIISTNVTSDLYRVFIGTSSTYVAGIAIRGNGNLTVNGTSLSIDGLFADNDYHTIKVVADYSGTGSYTLYVDGAEKQSRTFFDVDPAFTSYAGFQFNVRTTDAANNVMAFDDLSITVPEPGIASLFGATCVMGLMARRRAHS